MKKIFERDIPVYVCDNETEAINLLAITSEIWEGHPYSYWYSRGQGRSTWKLEAKIYRAINWDNKNKLDQKKRILRKEYQNMQLFKKIADEAGLSIPGDDQVFRTFEGVDGYVSTPMNSCEWPPIQAFDTLAFIQHHGMATQLLDFTRDPYVALYFAARQCLAEKESSSKEEYYLSVWTIDSIAVASIHCNLPSKEYWPRYTEITAPYAYNEYLKRQKGMFLLDRNFASSLDYKTIDEVVLEEAGKKRLSYLTKEPIKRIDVICNKAKDVLLLLDKMHVSLSNLMPSFDNIFEHIQFYNKILGKSGETFKEENKLRS
jgi:hypothetical protein